MSLLQNLSRGDAATTRAVVVFPHAGGCPRFYRHWADEFPEHRIIGVMYAGREQRLQVPLPDSVTEIAREAAHALAPRAEELTFFGHSFGALVAYQTAVELSHLGRPPGLLVVSGHDVPLAGPPPDVGYLTENYVLRDLIRLDPRNREVFSDPWLREIYLPAICNDYRLANRYRRCTGNPLLPRIAVVNGSEDGEVTERGSMAWCELTHRFSGVTRVPGGHFHLAAPNVACAHAVRDMIDGSRECTDPQRIHAVAPTSSGGECTTTAPSTVDGACDQGHEGAMRCESQQRI